MRSSSLPLLLACAFALALPTAASALDLSPILQPAPFDPLPIEGTNPTLEPVSTIPATGDTADAAVILPFGYYFYGQYFEQIRVGTNGFLVFGNNSATATSNAAIPNSSAPNGYVAAFWDDLVCPAGTIKTQAFGPIGARTFVVEWNGCYRYNNSADIAQAQVWLIEGSPNVRIHYGNQPPGLVTWSATAGIESPSGGEGHYALPCGNNCVPADFPAHTIVQFGRSQAADLQASGPGLQAEVVRNGAEMTATLELTVQNAGLTPAAGVTWEYFRSEDTAFDATDVSLGCRHTPLETIPGASSITRTDTCTFPVPPKSAYRICALLDPDNTVPESMEANNYVCSREFVQGADLLGTVSIDDLGGLGMETTVRVHLENRGSDPAGEFAYELYWRDCENPADTGIPFYTGTLNLAASETVDLEIEVILDTSLNWSNLCAELVIDPPTPGAPSGQVLESVETNNRYSTCDENNQLCMRLSRPNLKAKDLRIDFPRGCFFGDVVDLQLHVCNEGEIPAKGYGVQFSIDDNPTYSFYETAIVSIPQSCYNEDPETGEPLPDGGDSQCSDIGGGQPKCVKGLCRAPCHGDSNGDCADTGLECLPDPDLVEDGAMQRSCQFRLEPGQCQWVRTVAQIPGERSWMGTVLEPFEDGTYYFSGVADHGMIVGESNEGDNDRTLNPGTFCYARKADLEPVELDFVPTVGAGETFPVYRRVRNHGVVGTVYSYRYVLTSNPTASNWDVVLEIVGSGTLADATIEPFADSVGYDTVRIPSNLVGGEYYLGLLVDPENTLLELDDANNTMVWCSPQEDGSCTPRTVEVIESSLRVLDSSLPIATVGQAYAVQLHAAGGTGTFQWSVTSGRLPPGLTLSPEGLFEGTVLEPGYHVFQVTVTSGNASASATLVIQASAAASPLTITTPGLPPAYLDQALPYTVELGASGGAQPYRWSCENLPAWLRLTNAVLNGTPSSASAPRAVTCTVTDANDRERTAHWSIEVLQPSDLRITSTRIADGNVGEPFAEAVSASGGSGFYGWDFVDATIPPGLRELTTGNVGTLEGTPEACGSFLVSVTVTDLQTGATDAADLPLTIVCFGPSLSANSVARLPVAIRGEAYDYQLEAEGAVSFALVAGELPLGLTLSPAGQIAGTVADDVRTGAYDLALELADRFGATNVSALTLRVEHAPPPDVVLEEKVQEPGCSSSGESSASGFLPFAALLALLVLRRFRWSGGVALLAAAAVLLPAPASAQDGLGYGMVWSDITYERLQNGTAAVSGTNIDTQCSPAIQLPFPFAFYGETYERVYVNTNGNLLLSAANSSGSNVKIPTSASPNNFIAPWWDDMEVNTGGDLRYEVRGTAPNREFVVEWIHRYYAPDSAVPAEMQVSLYEDGTFAMRWGHPGGGLDASGVSGTVGVEDSTGSAASIAVLPCSASGNCKKADWQNYLQNKELKFATFANLKIGETFTVPEGDAGIEQTFSVTVVNNGPKAVPATSVDIVISKDLVFDDDDFLVGTVPDIAIPGLSEKTVSVTMPLPRALEPGMYYLLARVDGDDEVEEFDETDNTGGGFRFLVRPPMPDLAIESIVAPTSGTPGTMVAVDLVVANRGNEDVFDVPYWVVLSDNQGISAQDLVIHEGVVDVGWMQTKELTHLIEIPVDSVPVGTYYLGAVIDPNNDVAEANELNNLARAEGEFRVTATTLRIATQLPQELEVGAPFCIPLVAEGGDGVTTWSLVEGAIPPGVALHPGGEEDPLGASLCGAPAVVGLYEFRLRASSGGMTAEAEYSLEVVAVPTRLAVASSILPYAGFNRPYEAGLIANGGRPPYRWELAEGELPVGLELDRDGLVYGTPLQDGSFSFGVRVTDDIGGAATGTIRLQVVGQGRVECATRSLGTVVAGQEFRGKLLAGGGIAPYFWSHVSTLRYGEEVRGSEVDSREPPPGLKLLANGDVSGTPSRIGRYLWTVQARDDRDKSSGECPIALEVVATHGLTVATTKLPLAIAGEEYSARLEAQGGMPQYRWSSKDLRGGLSLGPDGLITGRLEAADLQGQESRTFSFLAEVRDAQDNYGYAALSVTLTTRKEQGSIRVRTETETGGCSTTAGSASLLALGLVALGLRRRR